MSQFEAVIGLEVHVQLSSDTKIFCGCANRFGDLPNTNVCEICTGQPGVLPVLNEQVITLALKAGIALDCQINLNSQFARKHYFYPDLPKGYQISQFERPYAEHGHLDVTTDAGTKRIGITRIHMEEDAGKNVHGDHNDPDSYLDFNRAGSPLIEIVSEPELASAAEAGAYLRLLHDIIRYIDVSEADMEKGHFRCDANISVRPVGQQELGTKAELKNLNSFRHVEHAIDYEIDRQIALIESGESVKQETRLWDPDKQISKAMRSKEEAHDYRYFPEPDLPPLVVKQETVEQLRASMPELPQVRQQRFVDQLGLDPELVAVLISPKILADFFEDALRDSQSTPKSIGNLIANDLLRHWQPDSGPSPISSKHFSALCDLIHNETISLSAGRQVLEHMVEDPRAPKEIVDMLGLTQVSNDDQLSTWIQQVIDQNPDEVTRYQQGDKKLFGFFMGQIMKLSAGKANPKAIKALLDDTLGA